MNPCISSHLRPSVNEIVKRKFCGPDEEAPDLLCRACPTAETLWSLRRFGETTSEGAGGPTAARAGYCAAGKVWGRATIASMTTGLLLSVSITILPARMPE